MLWICCRLVLGVVVNLSCCTFLVHFTLSKTTQKICNRSTKIRNRSNATTNPQQIELKEFEHLLDSFDLLYSLWWACCRNSICRTSCTTNRTNPTSAQTPLVRFVVDLLRIFFVWIRCTTSCGFVVQHVVQQIHKKIWTGPGAQCTKYLTIYRKIIVCLS